MAVCFHCGKEIIFRIIDGEVVPIHANGSCQQQISNNPKYETFTIPNATCPVCKAKVFFYQSPHGGRVFFDELGPPWPKHFCTENPSTPVKYGWQKKNYYPFIINWINYDTKLHIVIINGVRLKMEIEQQLLLCRTDWHGSDWDEFVWDTRHLLSESMSCFVRYIENGDVINGYRIRYRMSVLDKNLKHVELSLGIYNH